MAQIKARTEAVMNKFQPIGQAMYQQTTQDAGPQAGAPDDGSTPPTEDEDDVVEGEIVDEGGA